MNYSKIYNDIIKRAVDRVLDVYTERHHIVPRCLGGTNESTNLVRLTPEEHYIAHQLLVKIHPGNDKLVYAATFMTVYSRHHRDKRINNKLFGWIKRRLSIAKSVPQSEEHKLNNSKAQTGKKLSDETKAKMSASRTGVKHSAEWSMNISEAQKGRKKTPEQIEKNRQAQKLAWAKRKADNPAAGCGADNPMFGQVPHNKK